MRRPPDTPRARPTKETGPQGDARGDGISASLQRDRLLELSDERDLHEALRHADYHRGYLDGGRDQWSAGYAAAVADIKAAQHAVLPELQLEIKRWHVCCRACRLGGHRDGCTRCEDRTRATFANPHPDDYNKAGPE